MKILHVVGAMNCGGIETWLMHVLRKIDRSRLHFDFLVHTDQPGVYDEEIGALGANLIRIRPRPVGPLYPLYLRDFRRVLRTHGPYEAIHAHGGISVGPLLQVGARGGIRQRIVHCHDTYPRQAQKNDFLRRVTRRFYRWTMSRYMTRAVGCSADACDAHFGVGWRQDARILVLPCGIQFSGFKGDDRKRVRAELGISHDASVIGNVARFVPFKNQDFLIDVAKVMVSQRADVFFLLVGDGPGRSHIEARVLREGLQDRVLLTGVRPDVPRLLAAMDVFVMPSLGEGLGIVLVEAQASGLPCLISRHVPSDAGCVPALCHWLDLAQGPGVWADKLAQLADARPMPREGALAMMESSPFTIHRCVAELEKLYSNAALSSGGGGK